MSTLKPMKAHLKYLKYVLSHKWYVFIESIRLGIPFLGLIHDWHKFLPSEWFPYVHFFYNPDGTKKQIRDKTGYYKPDDTGNRVFDKAWFLHQKRAYHHWQSWCFPDTNGNLKVLPIPDKYLCEMLADWRGAARAQGLSRDSVKDWFAVNRDKMLLHQSAADYFESVL